MSIASRFFIWPIFWILDFGLDDFRGPEEHNDSNKATTCTPPEDGGNNNRVLRYLGSPVAACIVHVVWPNFEDNYKAVFKVRHKRFRTQESEVAGFWGAVPTWFG